MRKLRVLNAKTKKINKKADALDPKKVRDAYKAILQLKDGAYTAIEKAYSMLRALKSNADDLAQADLNVSIYQDLDNLLKARNALKEIG